MWEDRIKPVADRILDSSPKSETVLLLGTSDSGKTTFAIELAMQLAQNEPIAFVDADIGQSRIGPPTTIGWTLIKTGVPISIGVPGCESNDLFFVGSVSPVGHLLQFTAALAKCVQRVAAAARIVVIDTPGFAAEPAATSLWWAVQDILRPTRIILLQRKDEMRIFVAGVKGFDSQLEFITTPPYVPLKSMPQRQTYRQQKFEEYFRNSSLYELDLNNIVVQARENIRFDLLLNRIIALRDSKGTDLAIGVIERLDENENVFYVKSPPVDISKIACIIIGDVSVEIAL